MEKIVIYQSSTGFTKQYAEWIASDLGCEAVAIQQVTPQQAAADCIIYGGWVMGNTIVGLDKMRKMEPKQLTVFAVGSTPDSETVESAIKTQNQIGETPFFYFQGGFRFEKLSLPVRLMLKTLKRAVSKKENKTKEEQFMADVLGTSFDASDRASIAPLVRQFADTAEVI